VPGIEVGHAHDEEALTGWAKSNGHEGKKYGELIVLPEVNALVQGYVDQVNATLERWETIKKFVILPRDLTVEEGELTPSLKVKRKAVEKKYAQLLDEMYEGAMADA